MTNPQSARGPNAVTKFLRPKSVAIVGMSARQGTVGQVILQGLKLNNFQGDIHLVGRSAEPIDGRRVLSSPAELPMGVDLAVFTLPAAAVPEAVAACVQRNVGSAMIFAAGFAETGNRDVQDSVTRTAREGGLAIVGPNCLGYTNNVDGLMLHMLIARQVGRLSAATPAGLAIIGQSGGIMGHMQRAADVRKIPVSYVVSTGNEAGLESTDFIEFLIEDRATRVIAVYAEQIRRAADFLAAGRKARASGKPVVLLHPGRGLKSKRAAQSHTGALIGDYGSMRVQVENAGALVVNTMDEMMDLLDILAHFPAPPKEGPGIITGSGAYVALTNDFAEDLGLAIPEIQPKTKALLDSALPAFGNYGNPLDVTAGVTPDGLTAATKALMDDPNIGSVFISYPLNIGVNARAFNEGLAGSSKPKVLIALGDGSPLDPEVAEALNKSPAVVSRSSDRMFRALALYHRYGQLLARQGSKYEPYKNLPSIQKGTLPEWLGKKLLSSIGLRVPDGELARTVEEAVTVASRVGYPVALKAQGSALAHKTEAGGVRLNIGSDVELRDGWKSMAG
ncbi:MAG: acetate--CoA ligase family protein [Alphaproteobacteria bacterium]|nr:acetate--CoA ligase family protein [Alphaproteobacteria bacterium]